MQVIGFISYSQTEPVAPEYLSERISLAIMGRSGAFYAIPVYSETPRRYGLVFTCDYPSGHVSQEVTNKYVAECQQYFLAELSRERAEMEEEFNEDDLN